MTFMARDFVWMKKQIKFLIKTFSIYFFNNMRYIFFFAFINIYIKYFSNIQQNVFFLGYDILCNNFEMQEYFNMFITNNYGVLTCFLERTYHFPVQIDSRNTCMVKLYRNIQAV
jgi:hypothetical protein